MRKTRGGDAGDMAFAEGHEGEVVAGEGDVGAGGGQHVAAAGAGEGDVGPVLGDGGEVDAEVGPLGLQPLFEPGEHGGRVGGAGEHEVALVVEAGGDAVVEDHAVFAEHEAVAAAAGAEAFPGVGVDAVEELAGVGAGDFDLAEGGVVEDADAVADGEAFAGDGFVHGFAGVGVVPGAAPLADVFEAGAGGFVPVLHGGDADGVGEGADVAAGDGAEG